MKTRRALLLSLLSLAACADNNASLRISAICAPPDASSCTFGATCDAQYIGENIIDVGATTLYWLVVQVDNLMPNNGDENTFRTNTNDAFVQEYEVEYSGLSLPKATGPIPGSAMIPAAGTSVISVLPVNESTAALLAGVPAGSAVDIIANVRLKGVFADTTQFETGEFRIPIRVCNGCIGSLSCTAPALPACCPNCGQLPASFACVTP